MKFLTLSLISLSLLTLQSNSESIETEIKPSQSKWFDPIILLKNINRSHDGSGNNLKQPSWGSVNSDLQRLCSPNYSDGIGEMWQQKPNVRQVSNIIASTNGYIQQDCNGLNLLLPIYGQFVDHDIGLTGSNRQDPSPIKVPRCDMKFDPQCKGNITIPFSRASIKPGNKIRTNINSITAWMDASQIYGSSNQTASKLRTFCDGKVKSSQGDMLFKDQKGNYVAGDVRVNENIGLTSIHTVFLRQHNRICDRLSKNYPKLCDDELYTIARNYVIGLIQHITYDEYLPLLLGRKNFNKYIGQYCYQPNTSPNLYAQFAGAGYRLHSLVWQPFTLNDDKGKVIKTLNIGQAYSNPSLVTPNTIQHIFYGLIRNPMKQRTIQLNEELRNSLVLGPAGQGFKIDLFSANVQRGRDMGICSIPCLRQVLGLQSKKDFEEIFEDKEKTELIKKMYHQLENVDLYLAILGQKLVEGAVLGQIGIRLNAMQFRKIRNADRFWYEYAYPKEIVEQIKSTSFAKILRRNAGVKSVRHNAFKR